MRLGLRETIGTRDVVLDGQVGSDDAVVASRDEITSKWSSSVGVDLVDCDGHTSSGLDLGDSFCCNGVLRVLANVDVSREFRPPTLVHDICTDLGISNDGCILLTRADGGTVSSQGSINCGLMLARGDVYSLGLKGSLP